MTVWNPMKREFWEKDNLMGQNKKGKQRDGNSVEDNLPNDGWEKCPRCESNRVQQIGKGTLFFAIAGASGILTIVGFIIWPLLIISIPLFFVAPIALFLPKMNQCKDCNHTWKAVKKK